MKKSSEIQKFYYLYPQTVAVIGVAKNLMPAAWHTPISTQPPLFGILISPKRYTYRLISKESGFTINFLEHRQASLIAQIGSTSGRDIDKVKKFKIATYPADVVPGLIIKDSYAAFECKKLAMQKYGDHFFVIGKIILIHYKNGILSNDSMVDENKVVPMLYFGQDRYITLDPKTLTIHKRH